MKTIYKYLLSIVICVVVLICSNAYAEDFNYNRNNTLVNSVGYIYNHIPEWHPRKDEIQVKNDAGNTIGTFYSWYGRNTYELGPPTSIKRVVVSTKGADWYYYQIAATNYRNEEIARLNWTDADNYSFRVMPYNWGGYESDTDLLRRVEAGDEDKVVVPEAFDIDTEARVIKGPVPPGGYNNADAYDNSSLYRKYIAGIDCIGFVSRSLGLMHQLSMGTRDLCTIVSVPVEKDEYQYLKAGDFLAKSGHIRLFIKHDQFNDQNYYVFRESAHGKFPGVYEEGYTKDQLSSYYAYSIFPFVKIKPAPFSVVKDNSDLNITILAGYKLSINSINRLYGNNLSENLIPVGNASHKHTYHNVIGNYYWPNTQGVPTIEIESNVIQVPLVFENIDDVPGLERARYEVNVDNIVYESKGGEFRTSPSDYNYRFNETTNFTFYRYSGKYPPVARAVIIADKNNKVIAYYRFIKSGSTWTKDEDNIVDSALLDDPLSTLKVYVGFEKENKNNIKSAALSFLKSGDSGSISVWDSDSEVLTVIPGAPMIVGNRLDFELERANIRRSS